MSFPIALRRIRATIAVTLAITHADREEFLRQLQLLLCFAVVAGAFAGPLSAQPVTPQPMVPSLPTNTQVASAAVKDAATWSRARWNKMKAGWMRDKDKWRACRAEAAAQDLKGRKSWPVIARCMTASEAR
jgi:hypothetical protein